MNRNPGKSRLTLFCFKSGHDLFISSIGILVKDILWVIPPASVS